MSKAKTFEARTADGGSVTVAVLGEFSHTIDGKEFQLLVTREDGCAIGVTEPQSGCKLAQVQTPLDYVHCGQIGDHIAAARCALARRIKGKEDVARTLIESKIREFSA